MLHIPMKTQHEPQFKPLLYLGVSFLICLSLRSCDKPEGDLINPYVGEIKAYSETVETAEKGFLVDKPIQPQPKTEKDHIIDYIHEVFGEDGHKMVQIIDKCENKSWNTQAVNWNRNGTWDTGIAMINQVHGRSMDDMKDYKKNIDQAYKVYEDADSSFSPWSCAWVINETPFYLK